MPATTAAMMKINHDVLLQIFSDLEPQSLINLCLSCRSFHLLTLKPLLKVGCTTQMEYAPHSPAASFFMPDVNTALKVRVACSIACSRT